MRRVFQQEQVALVTGAAGDIGRAIVAALSTTYQVIASDLRALSPLGGAARVEAMDVTREASVRAVRDRIYRRFKRLDLLVWAAGVFRLGSVLTSSPRVWEESFGVNVVGAARCMRIFAELMARQRAGRILLIGSAAARHALKGGAAYAASKAALESLGRTAAVELAPAGIQVLTVSPGWVQTRQTERLGAATLRSGAVGRMCTPQEVAEVVVALVGLKTDHLTGACVPLDGALFP